MKNSLSPISPKGLLLYLALSASLASAITAITLPNGSQRDAMIGWLLAILVVGLGHLPLRRSIGQDIRLFLGLSLGTIFIRLFILIILIFLVLVGGLLQQGPFIIGLLTAYFVGTWMEIAWLAARNGACRPS